jgi:5-methylthioribose kinase
MTPTITIEDLNEYANTTDKLVFITDLFDCSINNRSMEAYEQIVIDLCEANNITIDWKD